MFRTAQLLVVVCISIALLSAWADAKDKYVLTDLGAIYDGYIGGLFSSWGGSGATDINNNGEIVGSTTVQVSPGVFQTHPFFWSRSGGMQVIGTLGTNVGVANALNSVGQVVGYVNRDSTGTEKIAFLWDKATGVMQDLGNLVSDPVLTVEKVSAEAWGINDAGRVVGLSSKFSSSTYEHPKGAFVWDATNGMQDLGPYLPVGTLSENNEATSINNAGQIIGRGKGIGSNGAGPGAYVLTPKQGQSGYDYVNLGWLGAGTTSRWITSAYEINDAGKVVGESLDNDSSGSNPKAYVWDPVTQTMTNLGRTTDLGQYNFGFANGINNAGAIVGNLLNYATAPVRFGDTGTGVIWDPATNKWIRLKTITAMNGFFDVENATAINDRGQIVGSAVTSDPLQPGDIKYHAVLLTPVLPASVLSGGQAGGYIETDGWASGNYTAAGLPGSSTPLDKSVHLFELSMAGDFATLTLPYTEDELASAGLDEVDLRLYWLDDSSGNWGLAGNAANFAKNPAAQFVLGAPTANLGDWGLDAVNNLVWANIDHASVYSVLSVPEPATLALLAIGGLALIRRRRTG